MGRGLPFLFLSSSNMSPTPEETAAACAQSSWCVARRWYVRRRTFPPLVFWGLHPVVLFNRLRYHHLAMCNNKELRYCKGYVQGLGNWLLLFWGTRFLRVGFFSCRGPRFAWLPELHHSSQLLRLAIPRSSALRLFECQFGREFAALSMGAADKPAEADETRPSTAKCRRGNGHRSLVP